jgi:hypothetical protein
MVGSLITERHSISYIGSIARKGNNKMIAKVGARIDSSLF